MSGPHPFEKKQDFDVCRRMVPAFWAEALLRPLIEAGRLVPLLEDWCGSFPGWHLCYPRKRHMPASLRAFVDFLRRARED
ncbi:LysR substrate-binding domain-containing protein [Mesorhizobium sp. YC-39]|uniref:LysR substrate-binding domain-containing protein n=1 Tax=unclassified Mesorhizobium TaxID=325217 RepID=UPI0021E82270|nr:MULTISPECIES: LysR substrate-binding domain-containing protein [unclassified Mesorhizobium]MCV3209427.1 LysR substrate-binding domain-containing protein [Mesorhizobium sp. YC-2]MCV3231223.1 LysR substrate-binding domain-containing protein [Mesorhizobium sp. YC-39]